MIYSHLPSWWMNNFYLTKTCVPMEVRLPHPLNHQEGNLKVQLLIKSGNYILPNPSITLQLCVIKYYKKLLFKFSDFPKCYLCVHIGYLYQTFHYHTFNAGVHPILSSEKILSSNIQGC